MKICKYCGSENTDEAKTCASCGAKEFNYKCENCGTLLSDGNFCPKCGVKYGTKPKRCPRCGAEYYSNACPDCGYRNSNHGNTPHAGMVGNSIQKRKTWLWILGWIFIFPLPLTVLISKNKKLNKWTKIGIITIAWIIYFALAMVGSLNKAQNEPLSSEHTSSQPGISKEIVHQIVSSQPVIISSEETDAFVFAEDPVVNRFISEFNQNSKYEITDITKGNIRTKYSGDVNGRYLEMINANEAYAELFSVTINGGRDDDAKQSMYEVFREVVKILDPSSNDDAVDEALAYFDEKDLLIDEYQMGNSILVTYVPSKESSYGSNRSHITIRCSNYK